MPQSNGPIALPDLDWITKASNVFHDNGPYFVSILFLLIFITLITKQSRLLRSFASISFAISVAVFGYGMWIWSHYAPNRLDPNVRYVLTYEVNDNIGLMGIINRVDLPSSLRDVAQGFASRRQNDAIELIIISERPIDTSLPSALFVYLKNRDIPLTFCPSGAKDASAIEVVKDDSLGPLAGNNRISFKKLRSSTPSHWEDLTCAQ